MVNRFASQRVLEIAVFAIAVPKLTLCVSPDVKNIDGSGERE